MLVSVYRHFRVWFCENHYYGMVNIPYLADCSGMGLMFAETNRAIFHIEIDYTLHFWCRIQCVDVCTCIILPFGCGSSVPQQTEIFK